MTLDDCVCFVCQFSPSGRCATLQVWSLGRHATDQLLLALWPGTARITRRCSTITCAELPFMQNSVGTAHVLTEQNDEGFFITECKTFFLAFRSWDVWKPLVSSNSWGGVWWTQRSHYTVTSCSPRYLSLSVWYEGICSMYLYSHSFHQHSFWIT